MMAQYQIFIFVSNIYVIRNLISFFNIVQILFMILRIVQISLQEVRLFLA